MDSSPKILGDGQKRGGAKAPNLDVIISHLFKYNKEGFTYEQKHQNMCPGQYTFGIRGSGQQAGMDDLEQDSGGGRHYGFACGYRTAFHGGKRGIKANADLSAIRGLR